MCDRLSCKSWIKISQDHVSDQRTYQNCNKSKKQLPLSKQYHVTDSSNHTQAGSLCKCTYQKPCDQGDCNCSMLCSRTTVSFCEVDECRCCNKKQKNSDFHYWENAAFNRLHFIGTFQSIAFFQEKYSGKDSSNKSDQTKDGVEIAASQTKDHAEWAAKEHQAADHNEHSDHKTGNRCGAASWLKFFGCKSKNAGAKYQSYNFRADVLNRSCTVESQCS